MAEFQINAHRFDPYKNFKFLVLWDGRTVAGISKISPLKRTTEVVKHRHGGDPSSPRKSPGRSEFEGVTLERGVTHDPEFDRWANKVWQVGAGLGSEVSLRDFRKDIIIQVLNEAGQVAVSHKLYRAWVSELRQLGGDLGDGGGHRALVRDIGGDRHRRPAVAPDGVHRARAVRLVQVDHADRQAVVGQLPGHRGTDAACRAGDNGRASHLSCECHGLKFTAWARCCQPNWVRAPRSALAEMANRRPQTVTGQLKTSGAADVAWCDPQRDRDSPQLRRTRAASRFPSRLPKVPGRRRQVRNASAVRLLPVRSAAFSTAAISLPDRSRTTGRSTSSSSAARSRSRPGPRGGGRSRR